MMVQETVIHIDEHLGKIAKHIDNVARGVRDTVAMTGIMDVVHHVFDWSSSPTGRAEVESLSEVTRADLAKRAVSMHNRTRTLPASVPAEFKTLCKAVAGFLIQISTSPPSPKCISQVIRLLATASAELQRHAAAKLAAHNALPAVSGQASVSGSPPPPSLENGLVPPESAALAARYRAYAYTCASTVGQLYSSVSLPAVVQTLPTQEVRELKGSAFQAALDAAEFVLSHGLPGPRPSCVYTPAGPASSAAAVCGAQLARHLLSSALEIANGLTRQHKVQFAETLLRLSVDAICRDETLGDGQSSASMGTYLLQLALQTLDLLPPVAVGETGVSNLAVKGLKMKLHLSLAYVCMTSHQCDKAFACLANIDQLRGPTGDSDEDRRIDLTIQYARFRILLQDGQHKAAEAVLLHSLLPRAAFDTCLDALRIFVSGAYGEAAPDGLRAAASSTPGAGRTKDTETAILRLYAAVTDRWPRDPEFARCRLQLLKSLFLVCPPGCKLAPPNTSTDPNTDPSPSAALRLADLVCTEHATRRRVLSSVHLTQLLSMLLSQMGHEHGLGHWAASLALGDSLKLLLQSGADRPPSAGLSSGNTMAQVLSLQADCYSRLTVSAESAGSSSSSISGSGSGSGSGGNKAELLMKAHDRASAAFTAEASPHTLRLAFITGMAAALGGADTPGATVVEAAICASEAMPLMGEGDEVAASQAHLSRLQDLLAALKLLPESPSPLLAAAKTHLLQAWLKHYRQHQHIYAASGEGRPVGYLAMLGELLTDFVTAHYRSPASLPNPNPNPAAGSAFGYSPCGGIGAILAASGSLDRHSTLLPAESNPLMPAPGLPTVLIMAPTEAEADLEAKYGAEEGAAMQMDTRAEEEELLTQPQTPPSMGRGTVGGCSVDAAENGRGSTVAMYARDGDGQQESTDEAMRIDPQPTPSTLCTLREMPLPVPVPMPTGEPNKNPTSNSNPALKAGPPDQGEAVLQCTLPQVHAAVVQPLLDLLAVRPRVGLEDRAYEELYSYVLSVGWTVACLLLRTGGIAPSPPPPSGHDPDSAAIDSPGPSLGSQLVMSAVLFELLARLQCWAGTGASSADAAVDTVKQARALLLAAAARLDAQAAQAALAAGAGALAGEEGGIGVLYPVGHRSALAVVVPGDAALGAREDMFEAPDAMAVETDSIGRVCASLSNLAQAVVCSDRAQALLDQTQAGGVTPASCSLLQPIALVLLLATLCRYHRLEGSTCISAAHNTHPVLSLSPCDFVQKHLAAFQALSAGQLQQCIAIASAEEMPMPLLHNLTLAAYQACFRTSHEKQFFGVAPSLANGLEPRPMTRAAAKMQGRLLWRLIELAESRQEALDLVCEYEQLAAGYASHGTGTDAMGQGEGGDDDEGGDGCPFAAADTEAAIALSFNYGVSLVELGQESLAERFIARAVGLLRFASGPFCAAWTSRMTDTYATVLERANRKQNEAHQASQPSHVAGIECTVARLGGLYAISKEFL